MIFHQNNKILRWNVNSEPVSFSPWQGGKIIGLDKLIWNAELSIYNHLFSLWASTQPQLGWFIEILQSSREEEFDSLFTFKRLLSVYFNNIANVKSSWFNYLEERQLSGLVFIFISSYKKINNFRISIVDCGQF